MGAGRERASEDYPIGRSRFEVALFIYRTKYPVDTRRFCAPAGDTRFQSRRRSSRRAETCSHLSSRRGNTSRSTYHKYFFPLRYAQPRHSLNFIFASFPRLGVKLETVTIGIPRYKFHRAFSGIVYSRHRLRASHHPSALPTPAPPGSTFFRRQLFNFSRNFLLPMKHFVVVPRRGSRSTIRIRVYASPSSSPPGLAGPVRSVA